MKSLRWGATVFALAVLVGALNTACSRHYVVVTPPADGYSARDTLYGRLDGDGDEIRVTFWFDTIMRVDTVLQVDTLWREGTRTVVRVDTLLHVDTLTRIDTLEVPVGGPSSLRPGGGPRIDTVLRVDTVEVEVTNTVLQVDTVEVPVTSTVLQVDTVEVPVTSTVVQVDTVLQVDTVEVSVTNTVVQVDTVAQVDTVEVSVTNTVVQVDTVLRVDTLEVTVTDTLRIATTDTVRISVTDTVFRTDTVRVAGRRLLFLPPGHFPPDGQCRVWIHGDPPGQQAKATACDALGNVPDGAFILFGGEAWDFDYDWVAEAATGASVPPEIVALKRRGGR